MHSALLQDPRWSLVLRVASSRSFKSSPRLRDLLLYVAECAIRDAPEDATEQQIGMKVFGRSPGYNSSEDSIVRSNARLLRQKLAAYFETEGAYEELRIDVPKGHYLVVFTSRPSPVIAPSPVIVKSASTKGSRINRGAGSCLAGRCSRFDQIAQMVALDWRWVLDCRRGGGVRAF